MPTQRRETDDKGRNTPRRRGRGCYRAIICQLPHFPRTTEWSPLEDRTTQEGCKEQLKTLLKGNMEVFAWEPADMTGVPRRYKCFLDAYKGYHQIQMAKEDEEKTAFYTEQGNYFKQRSVSEQGKSKERRGHLQKMENPTYQSQKGRNLEAYRRLYCNTTSKEETVLRPI
ncbi:hypothetical protein Tco_0365496 [Tanacetum coccineum]